MAFRELKKKILALLQADDPRTAMEKIAAMPPRQAVNPLFGLLYHGDMRVRWQAVTALGVVVARLADRDPESARVIMRRLMWNLNDESGGIGWGSPEAMGEIMARSEPMAEEYSRILISYLNPHGNYLEHPGLQAGALWAVARLAHTRPALTRDATPFMAHLLVSPRPQLRALAALAAAAMATPELRTQLKALRKDDGTITLYWNGRFEQMSISAIAVVALAAIDSQ